MTPLIAICKGHVEGAARITPFIYRSAWGPRNRRIWGPMKCTVKALRLGLQGTLEVEMWKMMNFMNWCISGSKSSSHWRLLFLPFTPNGATSQVIEMPDITCPEDFQVVICDLVKRSKSQTPRWSEVFKPGLMGLILLWGCHILTEFHIWIVFLFQIFNPLTLIKQTYPFFIGKKTPHQISCKIFHHLLRSSIISQVWPGGAGEASDVKVALESGC